MKRTIYSEYSSVVEGSTSPVLTQAEIDDLTNSINDILNDDILSASEKTKTFIPIATQLNQLATRLIAKAAELSISSVDLAAAQTSFNNYLNGLTPDWDDIAQDTPVNRTTINSLLSDLTDEISILQTAIQGQEGPPGEDALVGFLTRDSISLPATSVGVVTSYSGATGNFVVMKGSDNVTAQCTFAVHANPQGLTNVGTTNLINTSNGAFYIDGGFDTGEEVATVIFRATHTPTGAVFDKTFTITKSKQGVDGAPGSSAEDPVQVSMTRTDVLVATDDAGANADLSDTLSIIKLFQGSTELQYDGIGTANGTWRISNLIGENCTPGTITDGGSTATFNGITYIDPGLTPLNATVEFTFTGKTLAGNSFSIDRTMNFKKLIGALVDTTPPAVPTGLSLTSTLTTGPDGSQVSVLKASWGANAEADLLGYILAVRESGGNWVEYVLSSTSTYWEQTVKLNTGYGAKIKAYDTKENRSVFSTEVTHTTGQDTTVPGGPSVFSIDASFKNLFLKWTNPSASDVAFVRIYEGTTNVVGSATQIATVRAEPGTRGGYTRSGLDSGVTRYYWLQAVDTSGNASTMAGPVEGTTVKTNIATDLLGQIATTQIEDNAISTAKIQANAITGTKLALIPGGQFINIDPNINDQTIWANDINYTRPVVVGQSGFTGDKGWASPNVPLSEIHTEMQPFDPNKIYRASVAIRSYGAGRNAYCHVIFYNANKEVISGVTETYQGWNALGSWHYFGITGSVPPATSPPTVYSIEFSAKSGYVTVSGQKARAPADAAYMSVGAIVAYAGSGYTGADYNIAGSFKLQEVIPAELIVDGAITAQKIAANAVTADKIQAETITGDKINTGTSLPGSVTVGTTGVTIETVKNRADYAVDMELISIGSIAPTIESNSIIRPTGISSYDSAVRGPAMAVPCYAAMDIATGAVYNMVSLDGEAGGGTSYIDMRVQVHFYQQTGALQVYYVGTLYSNQTLGAGITGKIELINDGVNYRVIVGGIERHVFVDPSPIATLYPKWHAYTPGVRFTGLTAGPWMDNSLSKADPAARVNAHTTTIQPGKILISGGTTLSDWRNGSDLTKIEGGSIAANTVTANKVSIGVRGIVIEGIEFEANRSTVGGSLATNYVAWSAGTISYVNDAGTNVSQAIPAGYDSWNGSSPTYVYYVKGASSLGSSSSLATASQADRVILAVYKGGTDLVATYGRTIIDGSKITTGTVDADRIKASTVLAGSVVVGSGSGAAVDSLNNMNRDGVIARPGGGQYNSTSATITGSLRVTTPQGFLATMMKFYVDIYEYNTGLSCTLEVAGYASSGAWYNCTARVIGGNVEYPVYFGSHASNGKACVYIGVVGETWSYPQVVVRDFMAGYTNYGRDVWLNGWAVDFVTSHNGVTNSVLDTLPGADWNKVAGTGKPANNATVGAPSGTNVGSIPANNVAGWAHPSDTTLIDGGDIYANSVTAAKMSVSSLSAITGTIGLLRTATSGARMEIESNQLRAYDASGNMVLRLGVW